MDGLFSLSVDFQLVLIAGYIAHSIATVGRGVTLKTEELLLSILLFGSLGRFCAWLLGSAGSVRSEAREGDMHAIGIAVLTILISTTAGMIWRKWGSAFASAVMKVTDIYSDDHQPSTWASILATKANWTYIQVHTRDGRVLESWFNAVPAQVPGGPITLNDDGLAIYVTKRYSADGSEAEVDIVGHSPTEYILTYLPRSEIKQVEIGWQ